MGTIKKEIKKAQKGSNVQKGANVQNDRIRRNTINKSTGMKQGDMDDYLTKYNKKMEENRKQDSIYFAGRKKTLKCGGKVKSKKK